LFAFLSSAIASVIHIAALIHFHPYFSCFLCSRPIQSVSFTVSAEFLQRSSHVRRYSSSMPRLQLRFDARRNSSTRQRFLLNFSWFF
jgi:hypothetical protein